MEISSQLFYHLLSEKYPVERISGSSHCAALSIPLFYKKDMEPQAGKIYLLRSQDLPPSSKADCIFVCTGNRPIQSRRHWTGEILYITDREADLFLLFNAIIEDFERLLRWSQKLQSLLNENGNMDDFVSCSIPVFGNAITITDYNLRILSNCEYIELDGQKQVVISDRFRRVPDNVSLTFRGEFVKRTQLRTPFYFKGQRENPEGNNYCVNMYLGDFYVGTCTLWDVLKPMCESDLLLFQYFASYIHKVLSQQSGTMHDQLITLKSIFHDLLQSYPVNEENVHWALDLLYKNMEFQGLSLDHWNCLVICSANSDKTLPKEYLCTAIEDMLPHCTVVDYEDRIVCYCAIPERSSCESMVLDILLPYLRDMNFRVGVSSAFHDLLHAREYYLQAQAMLSTGMKCAPKEYIYRFEDYVLPYMLGHSLGEFAYPMIESSHVRALKNAGNSVNYWDTLRHYLDNECNASKTSQELFLHRSSLLPRLEKIRKIVDIDTPEQRLYLRICMYLSDLLKKEKN